LPAPFENASETAPPRKRIFFASECAPENFSTALKQNNIIFLSSWSLNADVGFDSHGGAVRQCCGRGSPTHRDLHNGATVRGAVMKAGSAIFICLSVVWFSAWTNPATAQTQQDLMKVCAEEWNSLKSTNKTAGKVYQDFVKECLAKHKASAPPAATNTKVNLNTATAAELDRLPHIGRTRAQAIIAARAQNKFKNWEDFVARKVVPENAGAAIHGLVEF
jgi:DNA uptake protein ComE-like DNA-binding protein